MAKNLRHTVSVVIPNWNGKESLKDCLESLSTQTQPARIIVVENGSTDGSLEFIQKNYPDVDIIVHKRNKGFAGGVNAGIRKSLEDGDSYVALINNDAVADAYWLENLVQDLEKHKAAGIVTCKLIDAHGKRLDSTGEIYTHWGLPYPRGRGELADTTYDSFVEIFAASGGATIYRNQMLREIGLFDEDFFAYYEDVDISFRAQLAGWKVRYNPSAIAYHQIGATSSKLSGFVTRQTIKNLPWVLVKNAPFTVFWRILPRFVFAYFAFMISAGTREQGLAAIQGYYSMLWRLPKKYLQRLQIQHRRKVSGSYIWSMMVHELPPNAHKLRLLFHPLKTLRDKS